MIDKLTRGQQLKVGEYFDEYLKRGLSCENIPDDEAKVIINNLYENCGQRFFLHCKEYIWYGWENPIILCSFHRILIGDDRIKNKMNGVFYYRRKLRKAFQFQEYFEILSSREKWES